MYYRSALKFLIPYLIGILIGWELNFSIKTIILILIFFLLTYIFLYIFEKLRSFLAINLFIILLIFGVFKIHFDAKYLVDDNISNYTQLKDKVILVGEILELPKKSNQSIRFVVSAESLYLKDKAIQVSGGILVSILRNKLDSFNLKILTYGKRVKLNGKLSSLQTVRNPGEFDFKDYLNLNGIYVRFYPDKIDTSDVNSRNYRNFKNLFIYPIRSSIAEHLDCYIGGEEAKFLKGLIIGERSEIPIEMKTAFINSGVMHILAVSGLHVAIVTIILLLFFQIFRIPEKFRIILTCIFLIYYIYLTGNAPSVTRAVIMAIVFLVGKLLERKIDIYNTLAFSAIIILLIDAKQLFQPGFQLSFVAVLSIVYLYPKIYKIREWFPEKIKENNIFRFVISLFSISIAAGIGTLPFVSFYFNKLSVISFLANLVIVPLVNVVLTLGMLTTFLSYFSDWITSIYSEAAKFTTWLLLECVNYFGNVPFAYVNAKFSFQNAILFYSFIGMIANLRNRRVFARLLIITLILLNIWLYRNQVINDKSNLLRVTFLDVGQGDAIFIEYPDGKNMLIDGGPKTFGIDAGGRFINPFLKYKNIKNINFVIVTHPDADHLGGIPTVLRNFKVDKIVDTDFDCKTALCEDYEKIIDSLQYQHTKINADSPFTFSDYYRIYPLNSFNDTFSITQLYDINNQSIVMKIVYGRTSLLLTGDAEVEAEELMNKRFGNFLHSNILKVAHHGSRTGTSYNYLRYVSPEKAIISVGAENKFGHPSKEVIERLRNAGCEILRTDESGAIVIESNGTSWRLVNWK